jgi:hypothetical protein
MIGWAEIGAELEPLLYRTKLYPLAASTVRTHEVK